MTPSPWLSQEEHMETKSMDDVIKVFRESLKTNWSKWTPETAETLLDHIEALEKDVARERGRANDWATKVIRMHWEQLKQVEAQRHVEDGDAVRAELEQCKVDRDTYRHAMVTAIEDERRWRGILCVLADVMSAPADAKAESLPDVLRERLAQRPAVDSTSAPLRACVPVSAEPELTPEQLERLGRMAHTAWRGADMWDTQGVNTRARWLRVVEPIYREGYRAAMARVREVLTMMPEGEPDDDFERGWDAATERIRRGLAQPPAQPSAESQSSREMAPDTEPSKATRCLPGVQCPTAGECADAGTCLHIEGMDARAARPSAATPTPEPQQPATLEERLAALEAFVGPNAILNPHARCGTIERELGAIEARLEERVGVLEAEGERVRKQAARTEQALREVVAHLALSVKRIQAACKAIVMPETP